MQSKTKHIVAVVIPCWNEENLLPEMLDSLLNQTFQGWCAFCVDDQSTDATAEVIKSYQAKDNRIQYVCRNRTPKGGQTCRNIGLELAKNSKYVTFFDADDLIAPYCLEQRVKYMEDHEDLDCAVFPILGYRDNLDEVGSPAFGFKTFEDDLPAMLNFCIPMAVSTNIYRIKNLFNHDIYWDENVQSMQDSDFSFQIMLHGLKYEYALDARADYFYRMHNTGVASTISNSTQITSHLYLMQKVTDAITKKYGVQYDLFLGLYIAKFLPIMRHKTRYVSIRSIPWVANHIGFKMRLLLYSICGQHFWSKFFRKYRAISLQMDEKWRSQTIKVRANLLERGAVLPK